MLGTIAGVVILVALTIAWVFLPFIIARKLNSISSQLQTISELLQAANHQRYAIHELDKDSRAPEGVPVE